MNDNPRASTATLLACCAVVACAAGVSAAESDATSARRDAPIALAISSDGIEVTDGGRPVLRYQIAETDLRGRFPRSNYIHPLYDLDGAVLTEDFPADHPWHRGVFWTWHQVLIGEERIGDPWICEDFQWEVADMESFAEQDGSHRLSVTHRWKSPQRRSAGVMVPFAEETVGLRFYPSSDEQRIIDFDIRLHALTEGLRIGGSENAKGYGGFSLRIKNPPDLFFRGRRGAVWAERTPVYAGRWLEITREAEGAPNRILVMTHKDHPGSDIPWILRSNRAMQNVVYPGRHAVSVSSDPEAPLSLRYRLIIHRDEISADEIEAWQAEYDAASS